MLGELPGFIADMDAAGRMATGADPARDGGTERPGGAGVLRPHDGGMGEADCAAAGHLDGVYCVLHGAGLTTADHDPEGTLLALVRRVVGRDMPVVASYDLHANVSDADVELVNAYIGYRTNPHLDMRERGAEAAQVLRRLLSGTQTYLARIRLPIVPPTVSMLTGRGRA